MYKKNILHLIVLLFFCSFAFLLGCSKSPQQLAAEEAEADKTIAANKAYEEAHKSRPATDPSLCESNSEGYLYLSVGNELFRFNKDSPLIITEFFPEFDAQDQPILDAADIQKGCKGNPYKSSNLDRHAGVGFKRNFKAGRDDILINFVDLNFGISEVASPSYGLTSKASRMKYFKWEDRNKAYDTEDTHFICQSVIENLAQCIYQDWGKEGFKHQSGYYVSNSYFYNIPGGFPYTFSCDSAVIGIKCEASYILYPSVKFEYSIIYNNPSDFNPSDFIVIDKYLRQLYDAARVKQNN